MGVVFGCVNCYNRENVLPRRENEQAAYDVKNISGAEIIMIGERKVAESQVEIARLVRLEPFEFSGKTFRRPAYAVA